MATPARIIRRSVQTAFFVEYYLIDTNILIVFFTVAPRTYESMVNYPNTTDY